MFLQVFSTVSIRIIATAMLLALALVSPVIGEDWQNDAKARLSAESASGSLKSIRYEPLQLTGGSQLLLISPTQWAPLASKLLQNLKTAHTDLTTLFGDIPGINTSIRLMEEDTFFLATKAPKWTNAMFFKGQIVIPMPSDDRVDMENLYRSVKHEYTHAVIHALSAGRAPGWLDEGLAQWAEGSTSPALYRALNNWLEENPPVPLSMLQGGFTKLNATMVPAAYAQSLVATKLLMSSYGFLKIRDYFDYLRAGAEKDVAFRSGFSLTEDQFEARLGCTLNKPHCIINPRSEACMVCTRAESREVF